jgi:hypothetical protein
MAGELKTTFAILSRRSLLRAAVAVTGVIGTASRSIAAPTKISKVAVNYQDHPDGDRRCDKCAQFQPPDTCKMVEGTVSPQGSCRIFMPSHTST